MNEACIRLGGYLAQSDFGAIREEKVGNLEVSHITNHAMMFRKLRGDGPTHTVESQTGGCYLMWPMKRKIEDRQSGGIPFSDAVVEAIVQAAGGTAPADPTAIAAVEAAAGLYARCLAGATITDPTKAITPPVLALIGRDLIRRGESVHPNRR